MEDAAASLGASRFATRSPHGSPPAPALAVGPWAGQSPAVHTTVAEPVSTAVTDALGFSSGVSVTSVTIRSYQRAQGISLPLVGASGSALWA